VHQVGAVGDTVLDLQAGYNAGVALNVGVLSGAHARSKLAAEPHTHLIASVADLPALIDSQR
jgi:phosphoglycolate phosphatase-like HAD superfamily hydrolase